LFVFFSKFVNGLTEFYPEIYDAGGDSSQHQINFGKKWGAYSAIIELSGGDLLKIDEVVKQPLEKCLLYLAFKADKNQLETLLHRESMKKMG
jgi:hypothetical protein